MKNHRRQPQRKKARRFLRYFGLALFIPVLLWGGANLLFSSAWGTNLVAKNLEKKLGFPCQIDRLSWTPWDGGQITGFRILVPKNVGPGGEAALVKVRKTQVWLAWDQLRQGKLDFTSIDVDGVDVTLGIKTLKDLSSGRLRNNFTLLAESKKIPVEPAPEALPPAKKPPESSPASKKPSRVQAPQAPAIPAVIEKTPATHFVHVENVNISVLDDFQKPLLSLENLAFDLPLGGSEAEGQVQFSVLKLADQTILKNEKIPLRCEGRNIALDLKREILGVSSHVQALVSLQKGLPLLVEADLPEQSAHFDDLPYGIPPFNVEKMQQRHAFRGLILRPTTWAANSIGTYKNLAAHDPEDGSEFAFVRGNHVVSLRGGVLHFVDFRFIGEEDSLLGNGKISLNGELRAVLRLVTSEERGQKHAERVKVMSKIKNEQFRLGFQPLGVPERVFQDLHLEGNIQNPMVDMGIEKNDVPLLEVLESLLFLKPSAN